MPYLPYVWKEAPFLRLIIPLITGILLQWNANIPSEIAWITLAISLITFITLSFSNITFLFKWNPFNGISINLLLIALGMLLSYYKNTAHHRTWLNNYYHPGDVMQLTLEEPLSEKTKSLKSVASVSLLADSNGSKPVKGQIILYFQKDSNALKLDYGSQIIIKKNLQPIKNSNNPGTFNYERYAAFQDIYFQVYLKPDEYVLLKEKKENWFTKFIYQVRKKVVNILKRYIPGEKERGLAEALLIGYKDDLDKTLVQSYSNTGVVHVVAISGLHLGLIYWLLNFLLKSLYKRNHIKWLKPFLVVAGLWLFAILAGAGPSVIRSAVMFTCIVLGENLKRPVSIYNTLAASAFLLLSYNPFWLWDVGFQLSYAAVLSIIIYMKPIYHWVTIKNKILDFVWKLTAVTLAAQILTIPISIYHFHQFPNYFLFTNILAVPLSSLIVLGEILLCAISIIPLIAQYVGVVLHELIRIMNNFIEHIENLPFSLWDSLYFNIPQLVTLYIAIVGLSFWLLQKTKTGLKIGLVFLIGFMIIRSWSFYQSVQQQKLIVYNIPQHTAIDFIEGRQYFFVGDRILLEDDFLRNFHLKPSRVLHRINLTNSLSSLIANNHYFFFYNQKILLIDTNYHFEKLNEKIKADIVIISKNPKLYISNLLKTVDCKQIIFDASNPKWKVEKWQKECLNAGLACFSVVDKGAFVINLH
ncbi:MAG TPA: ComEC/Rec2 family competence protein [Chitinophagaceae bacterium]|nr:ComEC/Rec2 family competence protein [Chitinophagaceae bacterium]